MRKTKAMTLEKLIELGLGTAREIRELEQQQREINAKLCDRYKDLQNIKAQMALYCGQFVRNEDGTITGIGQFGEPVTMTQSNGIPTIREVA